VLQPGAAPLHELALCHWLTACGARTQAPQPPEVPIDGHEILWLFRLVIPGCGRCSGTGCFPKAGSTSVACRL